MFARPALLLSIIQAALLLSSVEARIRLLERDGRAVFARKFGQGQPAVLKELAAACGGGVCDALADEAVAPLLVAQPECSQQDMADKIIDASRQFDAATQAKMIAAAVKYRQAEKNTPPDFNTNPPTLRNSVYCQKVPKNSQLNGLVQAQDPANDPNSFYDPSTLDTVARGSQPNTFPFTNVLVFGNQVRLASRDTKNGTNHTPDDKGGKAKDKGHKNDHKNDHKHDHKHDQKHDHKHNGTVTHNGDKAKDHKKNGTIIHNGGKTRDLKNNGTSNDNGNKMNGNHKNNGTSNGDGSNKKGGNDKKHGCHKHHGNHKHNNTSTGNGNNAENRNNGDRAKNLGNCDPHTDLHNGNNKTADGTKDHNDKKHHNDNKHHNGTKHHNDNKHHNGTKHQNGNNKVNGTVDALNIGNFGSCSTPEIQFGAGFDGRRETSFEPVDKVSYNHGSAQNIDIITQFMCDQLVNTCKADSIALSTCSRAKTAADGAPAKTGKQADAFNAVFGKVTDFANVTALDNQGNPIAARSLRRRMLRSHLGSA